MGDRVESAIGGDPGVSEEQLDLWRAIGRLARDDAEVIVLKHIEGWTYDEFARLAAPSAYCEVEN